ncbi:MAG: right-handed parallel beta-helix repeat-containing protein, partial [Methanobacteriota archaeon]
MGGKAVNAIVLGVTALLALQAAFVAVSFGVSGHASRTCISIAGDEDFIEANGVIGGSGTEQDPYLIQDWQIIGQYIAIRIENTDAHFVISHVDMYYGTGGIYLYSVSNATIHNCTMESFDHAGIAVWDSSNITIRDCMTMGNGHEGIILRTSVDCTISRNYVATNAWQGVMLEECADFVVNGNTVIDNVYEDAGIYDYQAGIVLFSCTEMTLYANALLEDSAQHAYDDMGPENMWDGGYPVGGNFWSDYSGSDGNFDNIGDTPYIIDADSQDRYPLMDRGIPSPVPELVISSPEDGSVTYEPVTTIRGTTNPGAYLTVNDEMFYPEIDGSFSIQVPLIEGVNDFLVIAWKWGFGYGVGFSVTYVDLLADLQDQICELNEQLNDTNDELDLTRVALNEMLNDTNDELSLTKEVVTSIWDTMNATVDRVTALEARVELTEDMISLAWIQLN